MSGRLKSPATHMVDLGYFKLNDFMVLYRTLGSLHDTAVYIDSDISIKRQRPTQRKIMLWNKTDMDGLKKEVTCVWVISFRYLLPMNVL
jgi:hypothetical protein